MYINAISHYLPKNVIDNDYFLHNGLTDEWIYQRTGIKTRKRASVEENTNSMAIESVRELIKNTEINLQDVDLIIGATYSPYDTVGTLSHVIQREFSITNAKALTVSSACSSFVNAVEIVETYFLAGKSKKALIISSEHNTAYSDDNDSIAGHLWGDGASACIISKDRVSENDLKILDVYTIGLGEVGRGPEGVSLYPNNGGIKMPYGKDVFIHAIHYMADAVKILLERNNLKPFDIDFLIPHQANLRIIKNVLKQLEIPEEKGVVNITELGNTGSASVSIALSQVVDKIEKGNNTVITVFGGGYSTGSILIQK